MKGINGGPDHGLAGCSQHGSQLISECCLAGAIHSINGNQRDPVLASDVEYRGSSFLKDPVSG
jgi:hypothetical protein